MSLTQLVYVSQNRAAGTARSPLAELRTILDVSRRNNARDNVTGYLVFDARWFFQVLEGERAAVMQTFARIGKDPRHGEVTLLGMFEKADRDFGGWSMGGGLRTLDHEEIFLRHGVGSDMDPRRLKAKAIVALAIDLQAHEATRGREAASSTAAPAPAM
ncbi:MAG: BLUF domain-containing protein [Methylobacteriaceae bacterium]|nr:BLUF domain-containing protein [Methylobacteriaceae bacterium]